MTPINAIDTILNIVGRPFPAYTGDDEITMTVASAGTRRIVFQESFEELVSPMTWCGMLYEVTASAVPARVGLRGVIDAAVGSTAHLSAPMPSLAWPGAGDTVRIHGAYLGSAIANSRLYAFDPLTDFSDENLALPLVLVFVDGDKRNRSGMARSTEVDRSVAERRTTEVTLEIDVPIEASTTNAKAIEQATSIYVAADQALTRVTRFLYEASGAVIVDDEVETMFGIDAGSDGKPRNRFAMMGFTLSHR